MIDMIDTRLVVLISGVVLVGIVLAFVFFFILRK